MRQEWGAVLPARRRLREADRQPEGDAACTRHGLPHPALMRFVLKLLANLTDPHDGDLSDRVINVLTRLTPAVR